MRHGLTTCLLFGNDRPALEAGGLPSGEVLAADTGSSDGSAEIIRRAGGHVVQVDRTSSRSTIRNDLWRSAGTEWVAWMEPGETVPRLTPPVRHGIYTVAVVSGTIVTREPRVWNVGSSARYENPVGETLQYGGQPGHLDVFVRRNAPSASSRNIAALDDWVRSRPSDADPYYHRSFARLASGNWDGFMEDAGQFLFRRRSGVAWAMSKYYTSLCLLYGRHDVDGCLQHLLHCVAANPLMAEFWCLLGDAHYEGRQYEKAARFYDNAVRLGRRRPKYDLWPLDVPKYGSYPRKMIDSCGEITEGKRKWLASRKSEDDV